MWKETIEKKILYSHANKNRNVALKLQRTTFRILQVYQWRVKAWQYVSRANFSWEIVTCLWIKHALCCRQPEEVSAIFILMILVDCKYCRLTWCIRPEWAKAKSVSRLTDELLIDKIYFNKLNSHSKMTWCYLAESFNHYRLRCYLHAMYGNTTL